MLPDFTISSNLKSIVFKFDEIVSNVYIGKDIKEKQPLFNSARAEHTNVPGYP